jgi:hypothetical protein
LKARLEQLEQLFSNLQNRSAQDAETLFYSIRSARSLQSLLDISKVKDDMTIKSNATSPKSVSSTQLSHPSTDSCDPNYPNRSSPSWVVDFPTGIVGESLSASYANSENSQNGDSTNSVRLDLPDAVTTENALNAFLHCSGQLFHVFSRDQIFNYYRQIQNRDPNDEGLGVATCCVAAMAAVGCQYLADVVGYSSQKAFYETARHYFEAVSSEKPLDAVKVCSLLAIYNILRKPTSSLAYIGECLCVASHSVIFFSNHNRILIKLHRLLIGAFYMDLIYMYRRNRS